MDKMLKKRVNILAVKRTVENDIHFISSSEPNNFYPISKINLWNIHDEKLLHVFNCTSKIFYKCIFNLYIRLYNHKLYLVAKHIYTIGKIKQNKTSQIT